MFLEKQLSVIFCYGEMYMHRLSKVEIDIESTRARLSQKKDVSAWDDAETYVVLKNYQWYITDPGKSLITVIFVFVVQPGRIMG